MWKQLKHWWQQKLLEWANGYDINVFDGQQVCLDGGNFGTVAVYPGGALMVMEDVVIDQLDQYGGTTLMAKPDEQDDSDAAQISSDAGEKPRHSFGDFKVRTGDGLTGWDNVFGNTILQRA
jgi:hypothetical protein